MTDIYLIRHAEAEGNLYRRAHGQYDSNLTTLGRRQLLPLAERFRDIPIDALYSSDLVRTEHGQRHREAPPRSDHPHHAAAA